MVAAIVLVIGVMLVMFVGMLILFAMGNGYIIVSLIPLAPGIVALGTFLLILSEIPLLLGGKEDRRSALRDYSYLLPTFAVMSGLSYGLLLWLW